MRRLATWLIFGLVGVLAVAATVMPLVRNGGNSGAREDAGPPSSTPIRGDETTAEPTEDVFARVGGWIAFRDDFKIVAVDPANPKDTLVLVPDAFPRDPGDHIAWSSDGTKLLLRSRLEDGPYPGLFVLHLDGSRTILRPGLPFPYIDRRA